MKQFLEKSENTLTSYPRAYAESPFLGKYFEPHGLYDGKMFHSQDKVTYIFISESEVVTIHFDLNRKTLFYNGHNIVNMTLREQEKENLSLFHEALRGSPDTHQLFYQTCGEILQKNL